ncbi:MAG TPA: peptidoglycan DD-metalloendopeptidase family protein [Rhodanobacteraceae bacterium]|nr:peptidoglycan DD-metalloendopeptidase family protein [Rhodanobacteraceae bacterium]
MIARVALVVALALLASAPRVEAADEGAKPDPAHAAQEAEARRKLDAVRAEIKALVAEQRATEGERNEAAAALRAKETEVAAVAKDVHSLDEKIAAEEGELGHLDAKRVALEAALKTQRDALAALLRSAYALGRDEELKLLLQQDDVAAIARVLAYNRYFQRARIGRIDNLSRDLEALADVQASIRKATAELASTRDARAAEGSRLDAERSERETLVADLDAKLKEQGARVAALGKDEKSLGALIEKLRDVFADIPKQLVGAAPFASQRGRLAWPIGGKIVTAFGAKDESGRKSSGILVAAKPGSAVRAVSHGRVVFADWLRGYGLMIIVDHGDGYLSLYGCNETLLKDVGDWVDAGETIATSGASGGQKTAGVYFELRAKGQAVDPKGWLK